eukprot:15027337-Alexandrium_andersonii.AAC.1
MGPLQERRLCEEWKPFIDDFVIVTGYWNGGSLVSDRDYNERVAGAARAPLAARAASEALQEAGFELPEGD